MSEEVTRERLKKSMTIDDALNVLRDTNAYGTMDIAKSVILDYFAALSEEPMDDLISRDAVLDACSQSINILDAMSRIEDLPSVTPKQRWIPVSDRMPEEREWYLVVFKEKDTGFQLIPRVADYIGNGENEWQIIDEDGLGQEYRSILECVAWMPLPESY